MFVGQYAVLLTLMPLVLFFFYFYFFYLLQILSDSNKAFFVVVFVSTALHTLQCGSDAMHIESHRFDRFFLSVAGVLIRTITDSDYYG